MRGSTNANYESVMRAQLDEMEANKHLYRNGAYLPSVSLGTSYTQELKQDISRGQFKKAIVGGYLTINGHVYDFAHPDYWLHTGDTECTTHHMVVVPRTNLVTEQMHKTSSGGYEAGAANTTEGGYIGSDMKSANDGGIAKIRAIIQQDFGAANILTHRELFTNAVANGKPTAGSWYDSDIDLMNEEMVYGCPILQPGNDGQTIPYNHTIDKSQLMLFVLRPDLICICNRANWWLRDVVSGVHFALVTYTGYADCNHASYSFGVRPAFGIC